jgi:hypothetical protein
MNATSPRPSKDQERKSMNLMAKLALVGALSMVSLPAFAHGHGHHGRRDHCHDGRFQQPAGWRQAPVRREVWVPGHWVRRGGAHVWINAGWSLPPQAAWVWVSPQWVWNGAAWQWQEAHWAPPS